MSYDRPPPTSYRDEQERWHPGPTAPGYRVHMVACEPCLSAFIRAGAEGEAWALAMPPVVQPCRLSREPIVMPVPGPPRPAGRRWLPGERRTLPARWRRYATPGAVASGAIGAAGAWLLPVSVTAAVIGILILLAVVIHRTAPDAVPAARAIRR